MKLKAGVVQVLKLSPLEQDALTELLNMGVGRAATGLSRMINCQVSLSVPRVELTTPLQAMEAVGHQSSLVAVTQEFAGTFGGRALLIFPEGKSLELVRAVLGENYSLEDIIELEDEALAEIGNVLLNGCLVVMANLLQDTLKMSLPNVLKGTGGEILKIGDGPGAADVVLFLYVDFYIGSRNIRGYIVLMMDLPSLGALKEMLSSFIGSIEKP